MGRTDLGYGKRHRHGHADKEGGEEDLGEEGLGVALGTVEALDDQPVELPQFQPGALQFETALAGQGRLFRVGLLVCGGGSEGGGRQARD